MTNIFSKRIDIEDLSQLNLHYAAYIIKFDYDNALYVDCTKAKQSVGQSIKSLIIKASEDPAQFSSKSEDLSKLHRALIFSKTLHITVFRPIDACTPDLYKLKYQLIESNKTYDPYGLNILSSAQPISSLERVYLGRLAERLNLSIAMPPIMERPTRARPIVEYTYINKTDLRFNLEWDSIKEAAKHYGINQSNIVACCRGTIKSAYGKVWRYKYFDELL